MSSKSNFTLKVDMLKKWYQMMKDDSQIFLKANLETGLKEGFR
jgi:hypothetical protein